MNKKYKYLIIIFLIVASFTAFGRIVANDFINFDDTVYLTENHHIKSGININTIKWAFGAVVSSNWHPITLLSHALDWSLFGANAGGHHFVSLLLHIGAVLFLFLFLHKTTQSLWPSAIVAALFALHPLRVESVAWAAERKDVLSMFFGMAALYAYAFYAEDKKTSKYFFCLFLFVLSLMSKPMLVTLPFLLLLLDYWPLERWQRVLNPLPNDKIQVAVSHPQKKKSKKSKEVVIGEKKISVPVKSSRQIASSLLWEKIPFIILTIISSMVTIWAQNNGGAIASLDKLFFSDRIINAIVSYVAYLDKIFWPVDLTVFYPYNSLPPSWQVFGATLILIGISVAVIFAIKKAPFLFVSWFWYVGTLVPVIGLVQVGRQAMADRYTYLPSIGIAIMLTWGLLYLISKKRLHKIILFPAAVLVLFVFTILTWQQCDYWKNSRSIFSHALSITKNNYLAHNNLGVALAEDGKNDQAIVHYLAALEINPFYDSSHGNLGVALAAEGKNKEAVAQYLAAIKINPLNDYAHCNLGVALAAQGKNEEAIAQYLAAIKINPANADAHYNLANLLMKQEKMNEAANHYRQAIKINPEHEGAHYNYAEVFVKQGNIDQAIEHFREAARIKPSSFKALNNLGVHLEKQLRHDEAIHFYRLALPVEPQNPGLHFNLGVALGNKGNLKEAVEHFRRAIELKPDFAEARRALKLALSLEQEKNSIK
jgi:tetratricopeptide (TPR) repeat protein